MPDKVEPIPAEEARLRLETAIRQTLGDDWNDPDDGWIIISMHDYMARLTKGRTNIDFYVDLLGSVDIRRSDINAGQDAGRLVAWALLILSVIIALMIARLVGWL